MKILKLTKLIAIIALCEAVGIIGSFFTINSISSWYSTLNKPFFSPPNWLFGPVWTLLYLLMGIAIFLILEKRKKIKKAVQLFLIQLALNFMWSPVFFGLKSPLLGLFNIVLMLIFIVLTTKEFYKINKTSAYLMMPYLAWVSFATLLNLAILLLN